MMIMIFNVVKLSTVYVTELRYCTEYIMYLDFRS